MVSSSSFFGYQPPSIRAYEIVLDEVKISEATDYNSHNTERLDMAGMQALLMKLRFMQATVRGELVDAQE